eukprot:5884301-Prymnesium_polylepis.1
MGAISTHAELFPSLDSANAAAAVTPSLPPSPGVSPVPPSATASAVRAADTMDAKLFTENFGGVTQTVTALLR